jgi:hypothetical protein
MAEGPERNFVHIRIDNKEGSCTDIPSKLPSPSESTFFCSYLNSLSVSELFVVQVAVQHTHDKSCYSFHTKLSTRDPNFLNGRQVLRVFGPQTATEL